MRAYQPPALSDPVSDTEKPAIASTSVAPLVQFFELVHIGDMIQSIVQVYFDKELVRSALPTLNAPNTAATGPSC
jgi:recyclin-1